MLWRRIRRRARAKIKVLRASEAIYHDELDVGRANITDLVAKNAALQQKCDDATAKVVIHVGNEMGPGGQARMEQVGEPNPKRHKGGVGGGGAAAAAAPSVRPSPLAQVAGANEAAKVKVEAAREQGAAAARDQAVEYMKCVV